MSAEDTTQTGEVEALRAKLARYEAAGLVSGEPASFRHINEPCEKHAKNPPGEQTFTDGDVDPATGLPPKKRDPNGFVHACPDCQANATIVKEG